MRRKLTAIFAADIAGYSRLMGEDEQGTLESMNGHRQDLWDPLIEKYDGRIVNTAGDSLLVEFDSAVSAVKCAAHIQRGMAQRNAAIVPAKRLALRIGINVGEVMVGDDGDIHGDGVNVAARIEGLAEPGGFSLSDAVFRQIDGRLDESFEDVGEHEVKNIAQPIRLWAWRDEAITGPHDTESSMSDEHIKNVKETVAAQCAATNRARAEREAGERERLKMSNPMAQAQSVRNGNGLWIARGGLLEKIIAAVIVASLMGTWATAFSVYGLSIDMDYVKKEIAAITKSMDNN